MLGMPDAAMVDQMALKEQVPDNMMVLWLASKGLPVSFASLVGRYRELQKAAQNPMTGAQAPKTTVAQDVNSGLASLDQSAVPPMPELTQLQDQAAPQPQMSQMPPMPPDQGQMPQMPQMSQPQMPPDQGPAGLASLDPGAMGQGMAGGGIIAFANGQEVTQQQDQQNQEESLFNQLNPTPTPAQAPAPAPTPTPTPTQAPTPAPQQQQTYKAPTSLDQVFQQYGSGMDDINKAFDAQITAINQMEVYQPKNDPTYDQERRRLIDAKLADQNNMPMDKWQALIASGQAMMDEASKPHEDGFGYMASISAGTKAYTTKLAALDKEHKTTQEKLDKAIIEQNHLEYVAQETNTKAAIDARNEKRKEVVDLQAKKLENLASQRNNLAQLGISAINARTSMQKAVTGNPTDYDTKLAIEYAALKEENDRLPPEQRKSEAQLRQLASQRVMFNEGQQSRLRQSQQAASDQRYLAIEKAVRARASDPLDDLYDASEDEIQAEIMRQYNSLPSQQSGQSSSAPSQRPAPTVPGQGESIMFQGIPGVNASDNKPRINFNTLNSSRG